MTAYREQERRAIDLETAAAHDLLQRIKKHRRRFALPTLIAATVASWIGMAAHALGYWSVLGTTSSGYYLVSGFTLLIAGALCAAPILIPGIVLYVALRAQLRRAWREEHRENGVDDAWLAQNVGRFG
jgi:hypothetical protein